MNGKIQFVAFYTKTIYFPPFKRKINILMQQVDGPCLLIAIFNALVLKEKISVESGLYPTSSVIDIIQSVNPNLYMLQDLINGYYVNPSFTSCNEFTDYPKFLDDLDIKMVHAIVPPKDLSNYSTISKYDYDTFQFKIVELESKDPNSSELKSLLPWNSRLKKQLTSTGIESIESLMKNGDVRIFFRKQHFACIYKYFDDVYSLITCKGKGLSSCCWHSLPNENGEFKYYDENFNLTIRKPWTEKSAAKSSKNRTHDKNNSTSNANAEQNDCNIA